MKTMKKIYYSLLAVLSCGMIASCQQDELEFVDSKVDSNLKLTVTLENGVASRTQLEASENGYKTLWSEGDALGLFSTSTAQAKCVLTSGAGEVDGVFKIKEGSVSLGTENGKNSFGYVGVYPYSVNTAVSKSEDVYTIHTEIPAVQEYAKNSFGNNASPMVGVNQTSVSLFLKNVGTVLVLPLKGKDTTIKTATLESKSSKIAGAAVVTVDVTEGNDVPVAEISKENGTSKIELSCGEGVSLSETEATNFFFVLAPGTYAANDLVITFYDENGNYFETTITADNELKRSHAYTFKDRTFEAQGQKLMNLYVRAEASAYMHAERIIPSLKDVNVMDWAQNLKDKPNSKALIEEAITYIALKNYKAAYDVLDGIPGFVRDVKEFNAKGSFIQKVEYNQVGYLVSMLEDIEEIKDIESLLQFMRDFENIYEGSGLRNKFDESLDVFGDNIGDWTNGFNKLLGQFGINIEGLLNTILGELKNASLVESLEKALAEPNSLTSKFLNYLFSQEEFMDTVKASLRTIVAEIEEASKNDVNVGNLDKKTAAINTAKTNALIYARAAAVEAIKDDFALTNETNLNNLYAGPWGVFQQILKNGYCIDAFSKLDILEVYDALVKFSQVVEEMIAYDMGSFYYHIVELEDYQENVDWWVIEGAPSEE